MKKKIITAVLTASVLLSFASCDSAPAETSESANEYERQLQTIYDNVDVWRLSDEDNVEPDWYCVYAITDFDQDGLLEVCKRAEYNNGPVTQLWIYEVTEDGGITALESDLEEPDSDYRSTHYPEFSINRPTAYYEEDDGSLVTYYDGDSNMICEAEYEALHDEYISNADGEVMIEWFFDSEIDMDHIAEYYSSFAG